MGRGRLRLLAPVLVISSMAGAAGLASGALVSGAGATDPQAQLRTLRSQVDATGARYFDALATSRRLDAELETLRAQARSVDDHLRANRSDAVAQAAALYLSQPADSVAPGTALDVLTSARDSVLRASASQHTNAVIDRYLGELARLRATESALATRSRAQHDVLDRLARERATLDADLAASQRAWLALQRSRAASGKTPSGHGPTPTSAPSSTTGATNSGGTPPPSTSTTTPGPVVTPPPPPPPGTNPHHSDPFLSCVRQRESHGFYGAVNPAGYYGAYQFSPSTWNVSASHAGRPDLIGVRPDRAAAWDQDQLAWSLYQWQGAGPWGGGCG